MNRKQKLIISITGITIVMLALLGLTYGYYLTRIQGNTNSNSISITTADLVLVYDDNNSYINLSAIMPGTTSSKTFTVSNPGTKEVEYVVGIDEVVNTLTRTTDLKYAITCQEKEINDSDSKYKNCETVAANDGNFPKTNSHLFTNKIKTKYIQKYIITISYSNLDVDQSIDMGSTIKGRMQIYSAQETVDISGKVSGTSSGDYVQINSEPRTSQIIDGRYKFIGIKPGKHTIKIMNGGTEKSSEQITIKQGNLSNIDIENNTITYTNTDRIATINISNSSNNLELSISKIEKLGELLNETIITNAKKASKDNSTTNSLYNESPLTTPAASISLETERTLSLTLDNYGESYYFRGNVIDNYVNFAEMCWRIVRIEGDGSVKLVLEDKNYKCNDTSISEDYIFGQFDIPVSESDSTLLSNFGYEEASIGLLMKKRLLNPITNPEKALINVLKNYEKTLAKKIDNSLTEEDLSNYINIKNTLANKLKVEEWCYDKDAYLFETADVDNETPLSDFEVENNYTQSSMYYSANIRLYEGSILKPRLTCKNNNIINKYPDGTGMFIGILNADEISFAGARYSVANQNLYLLNEYQKSKEEFSWWTLTPKIFFLFPFGSGDYMHIFDNEGKFDNAFVHNSLSVRPSIVLKNDTRILSGDGTQSNPYVIQ